ncbi:hypothetical protein JHK85_036109 [Glycine max]|nr:hypothetical protein JHK85_036109 [Glycine max]
MGIPTVLALPYPAQGHVNPLMTLSQKLVEHGCKVFFVNTDFDHKRVISQGMPEMDPGELFWLNMGDTINGKIVLNYLMQCTQRLNMTEWWLCNTTYELEHAPLSSIPKLVPIGPLLRSYDDTIATAKTIGQYWEEDLSCMSWLDQQPHGSVLYVAFGSFTHFDQNQFNELALGLDLTNRPFLWVVRQDNKRLERKVDQILNDENIKSRSLELKDKVMNNIAKAGRSLENLNRFVKWLKE